MDQVTLEQLGPGAVEKQDTDIQYDSPDLYLGMVLHAFKNLRMEIFSRKILVVNQKTKINAVNLTLSELRRKVKKLKY